MEQEEREGLDRLIARLALAVISADGRIAAPELASLERLDRLGLGALGAVVREEMERAVREPVDVVATCGALPPLGDDAAALVLTVLADLATSDGVVAPREREVFGTIAGLLGIGPAVASRILEATISRSGAREAGPASPRAATAEPAAPGRHPAFRVLGLEPGASRSRIETAYLDFVQRYDPLRMAEELGPEFAALAVRRLATITDAYEAALATLPTSS